MTTPSQPYRNGPLAGLDRLPLAAWYGLFMLLSLLLRQASQLVDTEGYDEFTFILLGSEVAHGRLPYVQEFDNKPPMMFFALGGVQYLFGKSLMVVRLLSDICIAGIAALTFTLARRRAGNALAGLAVCAGMAVSCLSLGQQSRTEHLAMLFLMGALPCALAARKSWLYPLLAGVLMSLCTLTRTNLALATIAVGLFFVVMALRGDRRIYLRAMAAYIAGGLIPLGLLVAVYAQAGQLVPLRLGLIDVPMAYASEQVSAFKAVKTHVWLVFYHLRANPLVFAPFAVLAGVAAVLFLRNLARLPWRSAHGDEDLLLVALTMAGVALSMVIGGAVYEYYWLQIFPLLTVLIAWFLAAARPHRPMFATASLLCLVPVATSLITYAPRSLEAMTTWPAPQARHDLRDSAARIRADMRPGDRVWAQEFHLILWYLDMPSMSRAGTHPDNLFRTPIIGALEKNGYVPAGEVDRIMRARPRYIVIKQIDPPSYFDNNGAGERDRQRRWLRAHYDLWITKPSHVVYRRRD